MSSSGGRRARERCGRGTAAEEMGVVGRRHQGISVLQKVIAVLMAVIALGVLWFLFDRAQGDAQALGVHVVRLRALDLALEAEADLNREALKAQLSLDGEATRLSAAVQNWRDAQGGLQGGAASIRGIAQNLDGDLQSYSEVMDEKDTAVEDYRTRLGNVVALFHRMRSSGDRAFASIELGKFTEERQRIVDLVLETAAYAIQSTPANRSTIDGLIQAIKFPQQPVPPVARAAADDLVTDVEALLTAKDEFQTLADSWFAIPSVNKLERLRASYYAYYGQQDKTVQRYRLVLAIYAGTVLCVFAIFGLRLRRSYADLDRSNASLQETNNNLEQLVESRTKDLRVAMSELRRQQAQMIQTEKMAALGQMVAGVAHEINTPLGYALSNVDILHKELISMRRDLMNAQPSQRTTQLIARYDDYDGLLVDVTHGLRIIAGLVINLKDFARVDRSSLEVFDLNKGVEAALAICQSQFKERIEVLCEYGDLPLVSCAPSQLNQVFLNVLNNAAQSIGGSGSIHIRTCDAGEYVEVSIRDSGCGMDAATQARIFEPFFTTKPVGQGTGLGLSSAFRIMEDHNGSIRVRSSPGEGSEFTISIPKRGSGKSSTDEQKNVVVDEPAVA